MSAWNRREILKSAASFGLLFTTTQAAWAAPKYDDVSGKTVVITGSNSGIGYDAAERLARRGCKVILACRTLQKAQLAAEQIQLGSETKMNLVPRECDLSSLESIRKFVSTFGSEETEGIDILCNNAGLARDVGSKDVLRSKDGFELTIGTNHLGHFYLTNLLLQENKIKKNGRIVVTASGVHDPDSPGGAQGSLATLGDLTGLEQGPSFEMIDGGKFDPDKAYKDSKLCNVFFTRELKRRLAESGSNIETCCFNPGLIVGTGLFREQNKVFTKIFDVAATNVLKVGETTSFGGGALEYMALSTDVKSGEYYTSKPGSSKYGDDAYGVQFKETMVSKEALDAAKGKRLWELSAKLVGV
uniref:Protochlorophyllide reductase n=1 Tax=Leptocylindrus danicus TaxID=163516 RepID=A0A7S2JSM7_9STRA